MNILQPPYVYSPARIKRAACFTFALWKLFWTMFGIICLGSLIFVAGVMAVWR